MYGGQAYSATEQMGREPGSAGWTSSSYLSTVSSKSFQKNIVVAFGTGDFFADVLPDAGLPIPSSRLGVLKNCQVNASEIDVFQASMTVGTFSFDVIDKDGAFSAYVGSDPRGLYGNLVKIYYGRVGVGLDFRAYPMITQGYISQISHAAGVWSITAKESTDLLNSSIYSFATTLNVALGPTDTSITLADVSGLPSSGMVQIDSEFISYAAIAMGVGTVGILTGCGRGANGSTANNHSVGASSAFAYVTAPTNPMLLAVQIMTSTGNGTNGPWDVLPQGCGIPVSMIDVAALLAVDVALGLPTFQFTMTGLSSAIDFINQQIMLASGVRMFFSAGKITGAILNAINAPVNFNTFDETTWKKTPVTSIDDSYLANINVVSWGKDPISGQYGNIQTMKDSQSISDYGGPNKAAKPSITYQFDAIISPTSFVTTVQTRLLAWTSTPKAYLKGTTSWGVSTSNPGDDVLCIHRYVPQRGGGLGLNDYLQVLSRQINLSESTVDWTLVYTSWSGARLGLVAPTGFIGSAPSQSQVVVGSGDGSNWGAGWAVKLWDLVAAAYTSDPTNSISLVSGDTLSLANAFSTTIIPGRHVLRFPYYDDPLLSASQKIYGFVAPNGDVFPDLTGAYQIVQNP